MIKLTHNLNKKERKHDYERKCWQDFFIKINTWSSRPDTTQERGFVLFLRQAADIGERMCQCTISDGYLERKFKIGDHDIVESDFLRR